MKYTITPFVLTLAFIGLSSASETQATKQITSVETAEFKSMNDEEFLKEFRLLLSKKSSNQAKANLVKTFIKAFPEKSRIIYVSALAVAPNAHDQIIAAYYELVPNAGTGYGDAKGGKGNDVASDNGNEVASAQGGSILSFPVGDRARFIGGGATFYSDGTVVEEGSARSLEETTFNSDGTIARLGNGGGGQNVIYFSDGTVAEPGTAAFNNSTTFNSDGTIANLGTDAIGTNATSSSIAIFADGGSAAGGVVPTATFDSNGVFAGLSVTEFTAIPGAGIVAGSGDGSTASLSSGTGGAGAFPITGGAPILPSGNAGAETPAGQNPITTP